MAILETDLLIVGAGPTGLFGAFYAGFRGMRVAVVDSLPELGGQITAMYPEKEILDIAGLPAVKGKDLVAGLVEQASAVGPTYLLGSTATTLHTARDGARVGLDDGTEVRAGAVVITSGIGKFTPRPLPAGEEWVGRGLEFFIPSVATYAGKDVVIVGGGDSACDWAIHLEPVARSVALVHRRDTFRAHQRTVQQLRASRVELLAPAEVTAIKGGNTVEAVEITCGSEVLIRDCDAVVAALGFVADLRALQEWGLEIRNRRHVVVDTSMRTNLERVFAAGDITEYPGKVRLIAVGFGEVATAVNNAAVVIDPSVQVFPGHSTDAGEPVAPARVRDASGTSRTRT